VTSCDATLSRSCLIPLRYRLKIFLPVPWCDTVSEPVLFSHCLCRLIANCTSWKPMSATQQLMLHAATKWPKSGRRKFLSITGFTRAINLLFHRLSWQKLIVLHKYLNDKQEYFVCYNFSQILHGISLWFLEFPCSNKFLIIPGLRPTCHAYSSRHS